MKNIFNGALNAQSVQVGGRIANGPAVDFAVELADLGRQLRDESERAGPGEQRDRLTVIADRLQELSAAASAANTQAFWDGHRFATGGRTTH